MQIVQKLSTTDRGANHFGSTGTNTVITDLKHKIDNDKHSCQVERTLTKERKDSLRKLIEEYEDIFAADYKDIANKPPKYFHHIDTGDHPPIKKASYRTPPEYMPWVREEINNLLKNE